MVKDKTQKTLEIGQYNSEGKQVDKETLEKIESMIATLGSEEQEEDKKKVSRLLQQYNEFKKRNLPNFCFNAEKGTTLFGKFYLQNVGQDVA